MSNFSKIKEEELKEFDKQFIKKTPFGISIGAIDNLNETAEKQVSNFLSSFADKIREAVIEDVLESLPDKEKKETADYYLGRNEAIDEAKNNIKNLYK